MMRIIFLFCASLFFLNSVAAQTELTRDYITVKVKISLKTGTILDFGGYQISGISNDPALEDSLNSMIPTEAAVNAFVKDYVATHSGTGVVDLTLSVSPTGITILNTAGADPLLPLATTINAGLLSPADKTKLNSDNDQSATNEIQSLSLAGSVLSISGGNSVTLPSGGGGNYGYNITDGGCVGDGTTDNTTAFQAIVNSNSLVYVPNGIFVIGNVTVPAGVQIIGPGTLRFKTGVTGVMLTLGDGAQLRDMKLEGGAGSQVAVAAVGDRTAVYINLAGRTGKSFLGNILINGFSNTGISMNGNASGRQDLLTVSNCSITNCWYGINTNAGNGNGAEYVQIHCFTSGCRYGVYLNSGNNNLSGNSSDNYVNCYVGNGGTGGNPGHCTVTGSYNHASFRAIQVVSNILGVRFDNINCFYGGIEITNSSFVSVTNALIALLAGEAVTFSGGGNNRFHENDIYSTSPTITLDAGVTQYQNNVNGASTTLNDRKLLVVNNQTSYDFSSNTLSLPNLTLSGKINITGAAASFADYALTGGANTTGLNKGWLVYSTGGQFGHGMDMGYSNSRFRTRIFTNNDISFAYVIPNPTSQSDFQDMMTIRGDSKNVGINNQNPAEKLDVVGNVKVSGNVIAAGLTISGDLTFPGVLNALRFNQTNTAPANVSNFSKFGGGGSTTALNGGIAWYVAADGSSANFTNFGYQNSRFRISNNVPSSSDWVFGTNTVAIPTLASQVTEHIVFRGGTGYAGFGGQQNPAEAIDAIGNIKASGNVLIGNAIPYNAVTWNGLPSAPSRDEVRDALVAIQSLPTGTNGQTLRNNAGVWEASSAIQNTNAEVTIAPSTQFAATVGANGFLVTSSGPSILGAFAAFTNNIGTSTAEFIARFYEDADNPTPNYVGIKAPAALTADFTQTFRAASGDIPVTIDGGANLDFPSVAAGDCADLTITVTGASNGDECTLGVSASALPSKGSYSVSITSANTGTVRFCNPTSNPIDPSAGTFTITCFK